MATKKSFLDKRHQNNPDYQIELSATGVVQGTTGLVNWRIQANVERGDASAAEILAQVTKILKEKEEADELEEIPET